MARCLMMVVGNGWRILPPVLSGEEGVLLISRQVEFRDRVANCGGSELHLS